jgi:hypothetical protein
MTFTHIVLCYFAVAGLLCLPWLFVDKGDR